MTNYGWSIRIRSIRTQLRKKALRDKSFSRQWENLTYERHYNATLMGHWTVYFWKKKKNGGHTCTYLVTPDPII